MSLLDLESEIKKEFRDSGAWLEQISNVLYAIFWGVGTWLSISTVMFGLSLSALIAIGDLNSSYNSDELIVIAKSIMFFVYAIGALVVVVFGIPKRLRNVFKEVAYDRVNRQKQIFNQADLVESVLIRHGLISEENAKQAKAERELK